MFSTGGSTLSVEKIRPVETMACEGMQSVWGQAPRQVVHIWNRGCFAAHHDTRPLLQGTAMSHGIANRL
ncbi:protein of unknown function [Pseudomonas sp. JV551A1]|uniref:Uncharacterized protein n=1 Tax=Pseudomonas inefficax TaxID=2078786 RepID=A0AAQ1PFR8_9PSED|nr:protein of unknown function [Pseudomonas sp. JV551A1]SPO63855.1 protein of unknown function [Pseudomonas inefficax]